MAQIPPVHLLQAAAHRLNVIESSRLEHLAEKTQEKGIHIAFSGSGCQDIIAGL